MPTMFRHLHARSPFLALALVASVAVTGCDDPAKGKAKAVTSEAVSASPQTAAATPAQGATTYTFDQQSSKVAWTGSKVTGKHDGTFGNFKGTVNVVDNAPEKSKVDVEFDTTTLTTEPSQLVTHLKSPDFFDVEKFPKATFTSTEIKKGGEKGATHTVTGNLTIKGISKSITFPATIAIAGDQATVDAEFAINRRDFSLNYAGKPNDLIRDDVVIKLAIKAARAKS